MAPRAACCPLPVGPCTLVYAGLVVVLLAATLGHAADSDKPVEKHRRGAKGVYDYGGNGDLSKVEVDMTVEDYGEPQKLRCHNCYLSVHGKDCMTLDDFSKVEVQECLADEPFCMVQSLHTNSELTTFARKCSRQCEPGCETAGGSYKLEYCYSCCKEDFCNTGNAALRALSSLPLLLTALLYSLTLARAALV